MLSAHCLIICTKFRKNILNGLSYGADIISILIITKGHNSLNIAYGVTFLVHRTLSNHGLHLYHFFENILNDLRFMERTRFQYLLL